jgi:hypothetical protein
MVNICELLINVVNRDKPKMLTGLGQNGKGSGMDASNSSIVDDEPPAERQDLTHTGTCTERGKPVVSPGLSRESEPQGTPKGLRVWDGGKSERLPVIGRIGVEPVIEDREQRRPATSLHVKTGRLPRGRLSRESLANYWREESR